MELKTRLALALCALVGFSSAAEAQKSKDTLRFTNAQPIVGVLYYMNPSVENVFTQESVFDDLVGFDDQAMKLAPLLATAWRRIDDKTVEFDLRDDVKFHDGEKFSADDVVYTLNWASNPDNKIRSRNWDWIEKTEKLSPTKVRVTAREPMPTEIVRFSAYTGMMPKHILEKNPDMNAFNGAPVGTGMYKVTQLDRNRGIFMERNEDFHHGGEAKPLAKIKKANMLYVPDEGARVAEFLAGDLDLIRDIDYEQVVDLAKTPNATMTMIDAWGSNYLVFDAAGKSGVKPLTDVRVRRAILMAINREDGQKLRSGDFKSKNKLEGMCFRFQEGCDYTAFPPQYDPAGAKKLLAEAGYPNGFDLEVSTVSSFKNIAVFLVGQLSKVGIRGTVDVLTTPTFAKKWADGKIQVGINYYGVAGMADIGGMTTYFFDYAGRDSNEDPEVAKLAKIVSTEMDQTKRRDAGRRLYSMMNEKAYVVPIVAAPQAFLHSKELEITGGALHGYGVHLWQLQWK